MSSSSPPFSDLELSYTPPLGSPCERRPDGRPGLGPRHQAALNRSGPSAEEPVAARCGHDDALTELAPPVTCARLSGTIVASRASVSTRGSRGFCYCGEGRDDHGRTSSRRYNSGHRCSGPTATRVAASRRRRVDAGVVRLSQRDIDGLLLCGEHSGAPFDLLATALRVEPGRLSALTSRWRRAGFAATGRLGPGPKWCWLTRDGMTATGLGFRAGPPALGRLAHLRAILAARLWMEASPAWRAGPTLVAQRASAAGRAARGRPRRTHPGCGDPLAEHRRQPVCRAGLGDRSGADPQVGRADHADHGRTAGADAVCPGRLPDRRAGPPGGDPGRRVAATGRTVPGGDPGPARLRVRPGGVVTGQPVRRSAIQVNGWVRPSGVMCSSLSSATSAQSGPSSAARSPGA